MISVAELNKKEIPSPDREYEDRAKDFYRRLKQTSYQSAAIKMIQNEFQMIAFEAKEKAKKSWK
jgi:hypothetical protein